MIEKTTEPLLHADQAGYWITDCGLNVVKTHNSPHASSDDQVSVGSFLLDIIPELAGSEEALTDVLIGCRTHFELSWTEHANGDGPPSHLMCSVLPHRDGEGCITGILCLVQDVTDLISQGGWLAHQHHEMRMLRDALHRRNEQLALASAELRSLDQIKSAFVSIAANELRTPLTAITGYLELLLDGADNGFSGVQRDYLGIIRGSAEHLLTVVNDLLDLTRIEAGRIELAMQPVDLVAVVGTVTAEHVDALRAKRQQLTARTPANLPLVLCDQLRARQILSNLIENAIKYTPHEGKLTIQIGHAPEEGFLLITVEDSGLGIPAAEQAKVFQRFFRASNAKNVDTNGMGLKLHIARALVELHGGRMWFESEVGRGTAFYLTLPIADVSDGRNSID